MKPIYQFLFISILFSTILSCSDELNQEPEASATKSVIFGSETGLETYSNSFYKLLPTAGDIIRSDAMTDYGAVNQPNNFLVEGAYGPIQSDGWKWDSLRNVNYFIQNCNDSKITPEVNRSYIALARFFRAWFYFEKVKRFGDVPWINYPMDVSDPALYNGRDSRFLVMDSVLADINFACEHITRTSDNSGSLITKYVALGLKSRICLYEASLRKYHAKYGKQSTANEWYAEAEKAAREIMNSNAFSLYSGKGEEMSYRTLFISEKPVGEEIMLSATCDPSLSIYNDANWWWTSATYGSRFSFTRNFIHTYLQIDGTPFTNIPDYRTKSFAEEVKNRDKRLQQSIRMGDYRRTNAGQAEPAPPLFSYTYTGYQPIKWCLDDLSYDAGSRNINSICIMRYAEILLNYAEAKAELGSFTDEDWKNTIGAIRKRAGITGGTDSRPTIADPYLQSNFYPNISDPSLLEIRRERTIELALEGFRFHDIVRWHLGELMQKPWNGFYVPALNTPMDLNEDGIPDVCFVKTVPPVSEQIKGVTYVNVTGPAQKLSDDTSGEILWLTNVARTWKDRNYLYPIPESDRLINPALGQNEGW